MELISPVLQASMTHALAAYLLVGGVALPSCWSIHSGGKRHTTSYRALDLSIMRG